MLLAVAEITKYATKSQVGVREEWQNTAVWLRTDIKEVFKGEKLNINSSGKR